VPPNQYSYGGAIAACERAGEWVRAVQLVQEMEASGCALGVVSYSSAISACAKGGAWRVRASSPLHIPRAR
jgi:pentatricopeptide repeat domain-containing protein 1